MNQNFQVCTSSKAVRIMLCDLFEKYVSKLGGLRDTIIRSHEDGYLYLRFYLNNQSGFNRLSHGLTKSDDSNYPLVGIEDAIFRLVNYKNLKFRPFTYDEAVKELTGAKVRGVASPADWQYIVAGICEEFHHGGPAILFWETAFGSKLRHHYVSDLATSVCNPEYSKDNGVTWQRCGVWEPA